tara:strand:- start:188 stop:919 length:732 start_codon:yes stop_codon:yes gene_type:complete
MNSQFWLYNPSILLKKEKMFELWPKNNVSLAEKLNAVSRSIIVLTTLGYFSTRSLNIVVSGVITLIIIVALYKNKSVINKKNIKEQFKNLDINTLKKNLTNPKQKNPYMNFMMTDYIDEPNKTPALPLYNEEVKKQVDDEVFKNLDPRLFKDLGDMMEYDTFARNFHTMPNTTNPNDQEAFVKFCYGDMKSCKEDSLECYKVLDECKENNYFCKESYAEQMKRAEQVQQIPQEQQQQPQQQQQ